MLDGIKIYSSDSVWCRILTDLGATISDAPDAADVNFDMLKLNLPATPIDIKSAVLAAFNGVDILNQIFGKTVALSPMQARIVILLHKTGGMYGADLRTAMGYAPDAATHTIDTAIYQLRKIFGHGFISNDNGVYRIGRV